MLALAVLAVAASPAPPAGPGPGSALNDAAQYCLAMSVRDGGSVKLPASAVIYTDLPKFALTKLKSRSLASQDDLPDLVKRFANTQPALRALGPRHSFVRFQYDKSEAWAVSPVTHAAICDIMVTRTPGVVEERDRLVSGLLASGWTTQRQSSSGPLWNMALKKTEAPTAEGIPTQQVTIQSSAISRADADEIQLDVQFVSGHVKPKTP